MLKPCGSTEDSSCLLLEVLAMELRSAFLTELKGQLGPSHTPTDPSSVKLNIGYSVTTPETTSSGNQLRGAIRTGCRSSDLSVGMAGICNPSHDQAGAVSNDLCELMHAKGNLLLQASVNELCSPTLPRN